MSKQDRQGVRTATDLEQKYNFGKSFAEIMGIATDAQKLAEEAAELDKNLTQEEIFNRLTNNGESQGIYRGDDGEIYINASYIKSGIIDAAVVQVVNLIAERLKSIDGSRELAIEGSALSLSESKVVLTSLSTEYDGYPVFMLRSVVNGSIARILQLYADGFKIQDVATGKTVGSFLVDDEVDGGSTIKADTINPGKKVLFTGNVAKGGTFTVPNTALYDLFAIKVSVDSTEKPGVILAYKDGNTIHGMGGWGGDSSSRKETYWVSITFSGNTWTLVHGSYHDLSLTDGWSEGTLINVVKVIGVI